MGLDQRTRRRKAGLFHEEASIMSDRFNSHHRTRSFNVLHASALGVALSVFGCAQQDALPGDGLEQATEDLYLVGTTWPAGSVFVCFDPNDGANATARANAQRVLADSWSRAAAIT